MLFAFISVAPRLISIFSDPRYDLHPLLVSLVRAISLAAPLCVVHFTYKRKPKALFVLGLYVP